MLARLMCALGVAAFLATFTPTGVAHAAPSSKISTVGVSDLDAVFRAAREIDNAVLSGKQERRLAREEVNASLGLGKKTPFADAVRVLQRRAPDTLRLQVTNGLPRLIAKKTLSSEMRASLSAVNGAVGRYATIARSLATLPASSQRLVSSLQRLGPDSLNITSPEHALDHLARISTYQTNIQVIKKLPQKTQTLIANLQSDIQAVRNTFRR